MARTFAVDASVIVRYLTGDDKAQSPVAAELFRAAQAGRVSLLVPTSAVQESVYVLETYYHLDAAAIAPKLMSLLALPNVSAPDSRWLLDALQSYRTKKCDFGDSLLCAFAHHQGCDVSTFDKGMIKKFPEITACTPIDWLRA